MAKKRPNKNRIETRSPHPREKSRSLGGLGDLVRADPDLLEYFEKIKRGGAKTSSAQPNSPFKLSETPEQRAPTTGRSEPAERVTVPVSKPPAGPGFTQAGRPSQAPRTPKPNVERPTPTMKNADAVKFVSDKLADHRLEIAESASLEATEGVASDISSGAAIYRANSAPDRDGYNVGFDFGSSSTKIIFHRPYLETGRNTVPMSVPRGLRATSDPFCWQTAVWYDQVTETFSLTPAAGATKLTGFKSAIVLNQGHRIADPTGKAHHVTYLHAAIAYLALMLAYVIGNYAKHQYLGRQVKPRYQAFFLSYPKSSEDPFGSENKFSVAFRAAFTLVGNTDRLRFSDVNDAKQREANSPQVGFPSIEDESPYYARTELEALIAGYDATAVAREGAHLIIDVGATTLDVAFFRYKNDDGERHGVLYATAVEVLGAQAYRWFKEIKPKPSDQIFKAAVTHALTEATVIARKYDKAFNRTIGSDEAVPVILCGGGIHCELHQELLSWEGAQVHWGSPSRKPVPTLNIQCEEDYDPGRLLIAWGLARSLAEFPTLRRALPDDQLTYSKARYTDRYVGKEQT